MRHIRQIDADLTLPIAMYPASFKLNQQQRTPSISMNPHSPNNQSQSNIPDDSLRLTAGQFIDAPPGLILGLYQMFSALTDLAGTLHLPLMVHRENPEAMQHYLEGIGGWKLLMEMKVREMYRLLQGWLQRDGRGFPLSLRASLQTDRNPFTQLMPIMGILFGV
jgi:hypothetical protein